MCYAGNKVHRIYIPPPEKFLSKSGKKGNAQVTIYYTGFGSQAKAAMEYAASILESILPDNTKLTVSATWQRITTNGVLGNSSITGFVGGWSIDAQNPYVIYPVSLAEKIAGRTFNEDLEGDLQLTINSTIDWYLGIDGNTPSNRYDLVTVVLHEICHGLGFFDSADTDGTLGWYGISSIPMIYDTFIENISEKRITDTTEFPNYSAALQSQIIGGQLYFNGPLLRQFTNGGRAKLWAPSTFDPGSSIAHLDEYATSDENALMTPYIDLGEAIHNPGKLTLSILGDLGWINTRIIHTPPKDTEEHLTNILLEARIESDTSYNRDRVGIVFSFDKFLSSDTLYMTSPDGADDFKTIFNIPTYNIELQYYFFAEDHFLRTYRSPSLIDSVRYKVFIGTDLIKPSISHTPVKYYLQTIDSIRINAIATDNIGVDTVYLEYRVNNRPSVIVGMNMLTPGEYRTDINPKTLNLNGEDSIKYRIFAVDSAMSPNTAVLPENGYFAIPVEGISSTVDRYSTDFEGASPDFFNSGFDISKPAGFNKFGLQTKHPYESPEDNNLTIEYTAILRHPVKFDGSGMLFNYNEVVLVEPGEPGSVFGSSDFYDYVIVEGSRNFGKTWFALADGYDSRYYSGWELTYNSSITGMNSTASGKESMLRKHAIYYRPSDKISAGDTMLIRFRLYSDPFANGWGWVVEDLRINALIDAVDKIKMVGLKVYPNPGDGHITISHGLLSESSKPLKYSVFNAAGICVSENNHLKGSDTRIDISGFPAGFYLIVVTSDVGTETIKYSKIR
jgi:hypothetical protein